MKRKNTIILLLMLVLSGCAGMNPKFDCPMKPGIRCESLDQVNDRVNRGEIGRYAETVQHVWIAPFEDTSGNYHEESNVYSVVEPGYWGHTGEVA